MSIVKIDDKVADRAEAGKASVEGTGRYAWYTQVVLVRVILSTASEVRVNICELMSPAPKQTNAARDIPMRPMPEKLGAAKSVGRSVASPMN